MFVTHICDVIQRNVRVLRGSKSRFPRYNKASFSWCILDVVAGRPSLRKQPTSCNATYDFPREMTSEEQVQKFHTDDVSRP